MSAIKNRPKQSDTPRVPITSTRRTSGHDTQEAIGRTAAAVFRRQGFGNSTLDDIAQPLGITRPAVLHHFGSKAGLLEAIVSPFMEALDQLLDEIESHGAMTARQQRAFFTRFVNFLCDNREVAALLARDITAHQHLPAHLQVLDRATRFAGIVSANRSDSTAALRALAALGTIMRPLSAPDDLVDLSEPPNRRVLVECALAALRACQ